MKLSYICLAGVKDKRLREFIQKLENPSLKEIQNAPIRYETLIRRHAGYQSRQVSAQQITRVIRGQTDGPYYINIRPHGTHLCTP